MLAYYNRWAECLQACKTSSQGCEVLLLNNCILQSLYEELVECFIEALLTKPFADHCWRLPETSWKIKQRFYLPYWSDCKDGHLLCHPHRVSNAKRSAGGAGCSHSSIKTWKHAQPLITYCLQIGHSLMRFPHLLQVTMWPHSSSTQSIIASIQMRHSLSSLDNWVLQPSAVKERERKKRCVNTTGANLSVRTGSRVTPQSILTTTNI